MTSRSDQHNDAEVISTRPGAESLDAGWFAFFGEVRRLATIARERRAALVAKCRSCVRRCTDPTRR